MSLEDLEDESESDYDDDDEDEYDLSPDEDEMLLDDDSEADELDDLNGRIEEIQYELPRSSANCDSNEDTSAKSKKRPREESEETPQLVDTSVTKTEEKPISKSQKKKLKKQKLAEEAQASAGSEKKVQFSPELEKGPTRSESKSTEPGKPALTKSEGDKKGKVAKVTLDKGVVIDEHTIGTGPKAKAGSKLGIRYVGKLSKNGKEFDKNTKGKPFRFTLGKGEVIKGRGPSSLSTYH
jgi:FK506-binding nuclear protein